MPDPITTLVEELFTNGTGAKADRLVLMAGGKDLGGWGRKPVEDRIRAALLAERARVVALVRVWIRGVITTEDLIEAIEDGRSACT